MILYLLLALVVADPPPAIKPRAFLGAKEDRTHSFSFAPDGRLLFSSHPDEVRVWDLTTGKEQEPFQHTDRVRVWACSVSPDGKTLVTACSLGPFVTRVVVWDIATRKQRYHFDLPAQKDRNWVAVLSPDARRLVAYNHTTTMLLYDIAARKQIAALKVCDTFADVPVAFSPDGKLVATEGKGATVDLWEADTGKHLASLAEHLYGVRALTFSPDSKTLASASEHKESTVLLWDVASRQRKGELRDRQLINQFDALAFSPDGRTLATNGLELESGEMPKVKLILWDLDTQKPRDDFFASPPSSSLLGTRVAFSPDGKTLATCGVGFKGVQLWDVPRRKPKPQPKP